MAYQCRRKFAPITLLEMRPPTLWHCALTLLLQATSHPSKRSSPTPVSSMRHQRATLLSTYNIGSEQGPSSRSSRKISRRPATMFFTLLRSTQKRCGHAYTLNKPFPTKYPSDSTRQLFQRLCYWSHQCQPLEHQQHAQIIVTRQIKQ